jgi:type III secretion inner rod protein HrpB2
MTANLDALQVQHAIQQFASEPGRSSSQTSGELGAKFQALMDKPNMAAPSGSANGDMSVAARLVEAQDAQLQKTVADMNDFVQRAPSLSVAEMSAGSMKLMMELSSAQLNLQGKMGVVESSKSAVETLMKNQ